VALLGLGAAGVVWLVSSITSSPPRLHTATSGQHTTTGKGPPTPTGPRLFAPDSVWNQPLAANAPLDPTSPQLVAALNRDVASELNQRIGPWIATKGSGTIYTVGAKQPTVPVHLDEPNLWWRRALATAFASVPVPADAAPSVGPDAEMTVLQPSTDRLWEFFHLRKEADGWHAGWGGAIQGVSQSPGYYTTGSWPGSLPQWGATATSLPVAAGEITLAEIQAGHIDHALAINLPAPRAGVFSWPAQRSDGTGNPQTIPEGAQLRLDPRLDLSSLHLSPLVLMMAQAAQKYGMIVRDQTHEGISFFIQDPASTGSNPFYVNGVSQKNGPYQGQSPLELTRTFPWNSVQVLKMYPCTRAPCER
jgi:hypothetical protein